MVCPAKPAQIDEGLVQLRLVSQSLKVICQAEDVGPVENYPCFQNEILVTKPVSAIFQYTMNIAVSYERWLTMDVPSVLSLPVTFISNRDGDHQSTMRCN